jgi:hypothetical protein
MEWVDQKRTEATKSGRLNPFVATMVAQISPGELSGVYNSLHFAKDLIKEWLPKYKFKNWTITETQQRDVSEDDKKKRASEIADSLVNHSKWRSHGRSLKIKDLREFLKINRIDDNPALADIVYRIQTIIKLLFSTTSTFKIFATQDEKILRNGVAQGQIGVPMPNLQKPEIIELDINCPKCGTKYQFYGKFIKNAKIDSDFQAKGKKSLLAGDKLSCNCGFQLDILGIRNDIESKIGKKFV